MIWIALTFTNVDVMRYRDIGIYEEIESGMILVYPINNLIIKIIIIIN